MLWFLPVGMRFLGAADGQTAAAPTPAAKIRGAPEFPERPFYHAAAPSSRVPLRKPSTGIPSWDLSTEALEGRLRRNARSMILQSELSVLGGKFQCPVV